MTFLEHTTSKSKAGRVCLLKAGGTGKGGVASRATVGNQLMCVMTECWTGKRVADDESKLQFNSLSWLYIYAEQEVERRIRGVREKGIERERE